MYNNGFMEVPSYQFRACTEPSSKDRVVSHDRGIPNLEFIIAGDSTISTMDDCFPKMLPVSYGSRILVKRVQVRLVDYQSCDKPIYQALCHEQLEQNRIF